MNEKRKKSNIKSKKIQSFDEENKIFVQVKIQFKNQFKKMFPSSIWNSIKKVWMIEDNEENQKKVDKWYEIENKLNENDVSDAFEKIEEGISMLKLKIEELEAKIINSNIEKD